MRVCEAVGRDPLAAGVSCGAACLDVVPQHGIEVGTKLAQAGVRAIHFYTMNLEISVTAILEVGWVD